MMKVVLVLALALVAVMGNEEANLLSAIVEGKDQMAAFVRPVADISDPVAVGVGITPIRIIDFEEKGGFTGYGTLTVAGWLMMMWHDANVGWNPEDYGGIQKLTIPAKLLKALFWVPDITPYDGTPWADRVQEVDAVVMSDGLMMLIPPAVFKFECVPDHGVNSTACTAVFGSWTHDGYLLDIQENPTFDTSDLAVHPDWIVLSTEAERETKTYPCCTEPYPSVKFVMNLQSTYGPFYQFHQEVPQMQEL